MKRVNLTLAALVVYGRMQGGVIDFEELRHDGMDLSVGDRYEYQGFVFQATHPFPEQNPPRFLVFGTSAPNFVGSTTLRHQISGGGIVLETADGCAFDLIAMDLSENPSFTQDGDPIARGGSVTFLGTRADGSVVTQTFIADPFPVITTVRFSASFRNLSSVSWRQGFSEDTLVHQFDNVAVARAAVRFRLDPAGPNSVYLVVSSDVSFDAGEFALAYDPKKVVPSRITKGPDFPASDDAVVKFNNDPPTNCPAEGSPSGFVAAWIPSLARAVLLGPGEHRILEIWLTRVSDEEDAACSPLAFVDCLGDPDAPVRNLISEEDGRSVVACTFDGEICIENALFERGDPNADGNQDISDVAYVLNFLFKSGASPECMDAADMNDDGEVDVSDPVHGIIWRFRNGPRPGAPFPGCGIDPTDDSLRCVRYGRCEGPGR